LALDKLVADLPETAATQAALELVVRALAVRQPWFMRLIMEDAELREAYDDVVASRPLTARKEWTSWSLKQHPSNGFGLGLRYWR
jgi:hypothetical protein